jgi:hypothetical protein
MRLVLRRAGTEGDTLRVVAWTRPKGEAGDFALLLLAVLFVGEVFFLCVGMFPLLAYIQVNGCSTYKCLVFRQM